MIPGLGQATPIVNQLLFESESAHTDHYQATFSAPTIAATVAVHELRAESEWRFEVAIGQKIEVRVSISIKRSHSQLRVKRSCRELQNSLEPSSH
jgi:hypothetical protein